MWNPRPTILISKLTLGKLERPGTAEWNTNVHNATRATRLCLASQNICSFIAATPTRGSHSPASIARRCTSLWVRWRCTFARTHSRASVRSVAKRLVDRGYFKAIFAHTRARNHTSAPVVKEPLPTALTYALIYRLIRRSRSIRVHAVLGPFPGCLCYWSTRTPSASTSLKTEHRLTWELVL